MLDLCLYIAGSSALSHRALSNLRQILQLLPTRHRLRVVDIYQQPQLARDDEILAVPTLVRRQPQPRLRLIGDLSDRDGLLRALALEGV